jgi:SAM-dependent methyltransferase
MARPDFSRRSETVELMDTEPSALDDYAACLADLAQVNVVTLAYRPTLAFLDRVARLAPHDRTLRILDAGTGYGDMLRRIGRWARRRGIAVELTGIDLNPRARQAAPADEIPIRWVTADILSYRPAERPDIVLSSLFAHHLDDAAIVRFLAWMEAEAALGWFLSDLQRHPLPYDLFRLLAKIARWHRFVRHDGPVSISRAFVRADWRRYLAAAGLDAAQVAIEWHLPFRLCLARLRGAS